MTRIQQLSMLLCFILLISTVFAFPSYLLTRNGCNIELDPTEVIMNYAVEESEDPAFQIRLVEQKDSFSPKIVLDQFPTTIELQVVDKEGSSAGKDIQYAMDVLEGESGDEPAAYFEKGSCSNNKRIAARLTDIVSVTVKRPGARLIAGWAEGHEAVKLTKIITFVDKTEEDNDENEEQEEDAESKDAETEEDHEEDEEHEDGEMVDDNTDNSNGMDWVQYVLSSCEDPVVSTESATSLSGMLIDPFMETKLQFSNHNMAGTEPGVIISLPDDINFQQFVVETSEAGKFEASSSVCDQRRIMIRNSDVWPILTVHDENRKITVWGMYSTTTADGRTLIHRTQPLEFQLKDDSQTNDLSPRARKGDPQKKLEQKILTQMDIKAKVDEYKKSREIKERYVGKHDVREKNKAEDSRKKEAEDSRLNRREKKNRMAEDDRVPEEREAPNQYKVDKLSPRMSARVDQNLETEMFGFSMHGYYWGSAMFVGSCLLTTQLCLMLSRRAGKGRRDL